jgi:transcriptional regulator with XRE-family HTH domain
MARPPARWPHEYIGEQVKTARKGRGWLQSDLASRLNELGFANWRQSKVAKLENGEMKRIALDDVLALAVALAVQPQYLLSPTDDDPEAEGDVRLTLKVTLPATQFRQWLRGELPLFGEDGKNYFAGALVPVPVWREMWKNAEWAGLHALGPDVAGATRTSLERMRKGKSDG